jgi:N-methylhydantoinase B
MARIVETATGEVERVEVDPVTLDLIENGLRNARYEMDEVLFRTALSPGIREQHDEFPLIGDPSGKMVVGQFGLSVPDFLDGFDGSIEEGDVLLTSDPYACGAAISHANDWLLVMPIFHEGRVVGWASMFGHMSDVGGKTPCSMPTDARTIYEEGVVIPPFKLYAKGVLNSDALRIILNQVRMPDWNRADLNGLVAACRTAGRRVVEMCERFGTATYLSALDALLQRNHDAMKVLLHTVFEEGRTLSFTDYICDDGVGNGPYELKMSLTRTGDKVHIDFTGSSPQAAGPINYYINENLTRMFFGIYMITVADPQILWNDGFYPLVDVTIPEGSYWKPKHPASLNGRNHGVGRVFDLFGGLLGQTNPALLNAAGFSSSPHFMYSGHYSSGERKGEVPAVLDRLRRHPRPPARRRPGRPFAVAELRQHPVRVPGVLLPAADREVGDGRRHRWTGAAPRRQRRRRRVRVRGAGHDRDPRRPLAHLPVGRERWEAGSQGHEVDRAGGRHPPDAAEQVPRRAGLPR